MESMQPPSTSPSKRGAPCRSSKPPFSCAGSSVPTAAGEKSFLDAYHTGEGAILFMAPVVMSYSKYFRV